MNSELCAIKDAWAKTTGDGRDDALTRTLCDAYVAAHPAEFVQFSGKSLPEVVDALSVFRAAGMEAETWLCEVWHLHQWAPQNIGGTYEAQVRILPESRA